MNSRITRQNINILESAGKHLGDSCSMGGCVPRPKGTNSFTDAKNRVVIESRNVITEQRKTEVDTSNLIVYHGRHWLMQRAFDLDYGTGGNYALNGESDETNEDILRANWHNKWINWLAIGEGGHLAGQPLEPETPVEADWHLDEPLPLSFDTYNINSSNYLRLANHGAGSEYAGGGAPGSIDLETDYHRIDTGYPQYLVDWNVTGNPDPPYMQDPNYGDMQMLSDASYKLDSYLRAHIRVTLLNSEANGEKYYDPGASANLYQDISEAGLYASPSNNPQDYAGIYTEDEDDDTFRLWEPEMFARVCFSAIRKDETREIVFNWYTYF